MAPINAAARAECERLGTILVPVFRGAFLHGHPFAEFIDGWLVGSRDPSPVARPGATGGSVLLVPRRDVSLVLTWASQYVGSNLDPALRTVLASRWARAYSYLHRDPLRVDLLAK